MFLIAQVFSAIGAVLLLISTFSKTKEKMLGIQVFDAISNSIADAILGGWSGVMLNIICIIRNVTTIKENGKLNKAAMGVLVFLTFVITISVNKSGILPLIAEIEYTLVVSRCDLYKSKVALSLNLFLWMFYDLILRSYPVAVADFIILVSSLVALANTSKERNQGNRVVSLNLDSVTKKDDGVRGGDKSE